MDEQPSHDAVPRTVGRVLDLLEFVVADDHCTLTEAATATGLTPTTALRHLRALQARGYLDRDDLGTYTAGPTMIGFAAIMSRDGPVARLVAAAQPFLDELADVTGESAYLALADDAAATYVARAESSRAIRHVGWVGQRIPLATSAVGAALDAPGTTAVRTGAVEPDITAVSHALAPTAQLRPAISVVGPSHRIDEATAAEIGRHLHAAATRLDRLGVLSPSTTDRRSEGRAS
jgi:DNA-binding IclR family transcriptional regulator